MRTINSFAEPESNSNYFVVRQKKYGMLASESKNLYFKKKNNKWSCLLRQMEILVIIQKDVFRKSPGISKPSQTIFGMRKHIIYKISKNSPLSLQLCNLCKPVIIFPNRVHQFEKHWLLLFSVVMDKSLIAKQNKQYKRGNVTEFQKCIFSTWIVDRSFFFLL